MTKNGAVSLRRTLVHASFFALAAASAQSHAQINFQDLLKKAQQGLQQKPATPAPARTQQQQTPQQSSSNANRPAAPAEGVNLANELQAPPDILGISIGMPAEKIPALLKERHLQKYAERTMQLGFQNGQNITEPVPGSEFVALMSANTPRSSRPSNTEYIEVHLTPIRGSQRVAYVGRQVNIGKQEDYLLQSKVREALIAKYGPPTAVNTVYSSEWLLWRYKGKPTSANPAQFNYQCNAGQGIDTAINTDWADPSVRGSQVYSWVLNVTRSAGELPKFIELCGEISVTAAMGATNMNAKQEERVTSFYRVELWSLQVASESIKGVDALIVAARRNKDKQNLDRAVKQGKPDL